MEFRRIMVYIDELKYENKPDYNFIRQLIQLAVKNNDIKLNQKYDWEFSETEEKYS